MRLRSVRRTALVCSCSLLLGLTGSLAAEDDLAPIVERLGSADITARVRALRDMMRLGPPAEKARPIIEKMLADPAETVRGELPWAVKELLQERGTDILEQLFNDPDAGVRDSAIQAACQMFDKSRPRDLCSAAFDNPDSGARIEVLRVLKERFPNHPEAAAIFRRGLGDESELVKRAAVFGAQAARDAKAVPLLAVAARESSELVAVPAVVEAMASIASPEAVDELISLLPKPKGEPGQPATPADPVRAAAARALARVKATKALPALRQQMSDPNVPIRLGVMEALMEMRDKKSVPLIAAQLRDPEERIRRFALRALRIIDDPSGVPAVRKTLAEDELPVVRATAVSTLTDLAGEAAIPALKLAAGDLDASVRLEVAGALAGLGSKAAPVLVSLVSDSDPGVRAMAIEGVGQIGTAAEIPMLDKAAMDTDRRNKQVRVAVAEALGRIGDPAALPSLERLSKDPEPSVRQRAADALGRIGNDEAYRLLGTLARDKVSRVRSAARRALAEVDRQRTAAPKGKKSK